MIPEAAAAVQEKAQAAVEQALAAEEFAAFAGYD